MSDFLQVEKQGRIAILRMSKPEAMNALSSLEDCDNIISTLESLNFDRSVSVVILTGSGRAFSAGGDLKAMQARTGIGPQEQPDSTRFNYRRGVQKVTRAFMDLELPAIAAINGHAIGLGLDLACLCDMRIAAESAMMSASFIKIGLVPGDGGAWSLQKILGYSKAAELFFTGERFGAAAALEMGLVGQVVPDDKLMDAALELANKIAANPARSLRLTKRLLREAQTGGMEEVLQLSAAYQALAHETADHAEALAAMLEKRAPNYTGE